MSQRKNIDMVNGRILPNMITFAIPIMISDLLQMFYTAADTIVVGKFAGEIPLAAVGATGTIVFLILGFCNGMTTGFTVLTAQRFV